MDATAEAVCGRQNLAAPPPTEVSNVNVAEIIGHAKTAILTAMKEILPMMVESSPHGALARI